MTNMPHFNINTDFLKENTRSYSCGFLRYFHFLLLNASFELSAVVTLKFNFNNKKNVILWILIILHRWQQRLMGINIFRRSWRTEHDSSETRVEIIKTSGRSLSFWFRYFLLYFEVLSSCVTFWFSFPSFICFSDPFCSSPVISYLYPPMYLSPWLNPYFYPLDLRTKALVKLTVRCLLSSHQELWVIRSVNSVEVCIPSRLSGSLEVIKSACGLLWTGWNVSFDSPQDLRTPRECVRKVPESAVGCRLVFIALRQFVCPVLVMRHSLPAFLLWIVVYRVLYFFVLP